MRDGAGNVDQNRRYWNRYARSWTRSFRGFEADADGPRPDAYGHLGDEWGSPADVEAVLERFVYPHVDASSVVVEIGAGGGRVAARVAPRVGRLYALDVSPDMLDRLARALGSQPNLTPVLTAGAEIPSPVPEGEVDLVYGFDVFVHLDVHTMWAYIREAARVLRPGGRLFVHTANLRTERGWARFASQRSFTLEGHYFVTPEVVRTLAERAGLRPVEEASEDRANFYAARDYLALFER